MMHKLTVRQTFGGEDIIYNLPEFDGEKDVEVMTADDFLTRCSEIGVPQLDRIQVDCILRVLSKPEISNAIKLKDLETLMSNFGPPSPREYEQMADQAQDNQDENRDSPPEAPEKTPKRKSKQNQRKQQISLMIDN